jgi:hypothetical protein
MLVVTVVAVASARFFVPAPPPAASQAYAAPAAGVSPAVIVAPVMMPAPQATSEGSVADWVVPSVAMLGIGGILFKLATSDGAAKQGLSRRNLLGGAAAAAAALSPLAANADGAGSKAVKERSRAIYGSRIFRLSGKSTEEVLDEKNLFQLFITGAYRGEVGSKDLVKQLKTIAQTIEKSAKAGDSGSTQSALKEFIQVAKIRELDTVPGGNFDPTQRRNAGAPGTFEIEAQMGTQAFSLYKPLKDGSKPAVNKVN